MNRLYLASLSPRRSQLLKQIGVVFDIIPIEIDESSFENELPQDLVKRLSFLKASKGMNLLSENKYNCCKMSHPSFQGASKIHALSKL